MLIRYFGRAILFTAPNEGQGSGGAAPPTPQPAPQPEPTPQPQQGYQRLLERNGNDAGSVATLLYQENYQHRQRIRELEGRLPKEGTVSLTAEEHQTIIAERDAIAKERDALKAQVEETTRKETLRDAARVANLNADALLQLPLQIPVEVTGEGEARKAEVVNDGVRTPLEDYLKAAYAPLWPALQQSQQAGGTPFPQQVAGRSTPQSAASRHIKKTKYALPGQKSE